MKTILETVIDDIKQLRGADVYIFGQPQKLKKELDDLEIDVIDVLENFRNYEIDINEIDMLDYIEIENNNTYNWNSPISNDLNYTIYKNDDHNYIVECRVHRFGDVRSNYTDYFYLEFNFDSEFSETLIETNIYEYIEIDGVTYDFEIDVLSDTIEVNSIDGAYIGSVCAYDMDELKSEIKDLVD